LGIHSPRALSYTARHKSQKYSLRSPGYPIGVGYDEVFKTYCHFGITYILGRSRIWQSFTSSSSTPTPSSSPIRQPRHPQLSNIVIPNCPTSSSPTWLGIHIPQAMNRTARHKNQKYSLRSSGSPIWVGDDGNFKGRGDDSDFNKLSIVLILKS